MKERKPWPGVVPLLRQAAAGVKRFFVRWIIGYRSPQEKIEDQRRKVVLMEAQKARDERDAEAEDFATKIRDTYTRYNICYRYKKSEGSTMDYIQEVEFIRPFVHDENMVRMKVDTRHLPRGISLTQLEDDAIKRLMSINCRHRVTTYSSEATGYWIMVERDEGVGGIPRHIFFKQMIDERPAHLAGERLAFPVGIGENKKPVWRTVTQAVNLLIAGSPDAGKSNMANAIICSLIKHNTPQQLRLLLVDLKGGLEFSFYAGLTDYLLKIPKPKVKPKKDQEEAVEPPGSEAEETDELNDAEPAEVEIDIEDDEIDAEEDDPAAERIPAFIDRREHVPAALKWLHLETERRMKILGKAGVKKIQTYNQKNPLNMMPYIVAFIDEWADVKLDRALGAKCESLLVNVSNRSRATGVHIFLATQSPVKEVLSRRVMNAMNSRIIFRCADVYMSQILMQTYEASQIATNLKGRGFWISGSDKIALQTPYIPDEVVEAIVSDASGGKVEAVAPAIRHDVQDREIFEWALEHNEGNLGSRELYEQFKSRGFSQLDSQKFTKGKMGKAIEVKGAMYTLSPSSGVGRNKKPARLLPIT